jgi:Cu(I)/Ag(I) efflux system periplasmic protein CusF
MRKALLFASLLALLTMAAPPIVRAQTEMIDGQVTKIDESAGKITIRHGPVKKFDMDAMNMVFRVKDAAMLKAVKTGEKIKFDIDRINGQFTVIKIEKAK